VVVSVDVDGGLTTTTRGGFTTVFLVTVLLVTLGAAGTVVIVVLDSLEVCDQALPVVPRATANTAAGIHIRGIFIPPTSISLGRHCTLSLDFVRASSRTAIQYKHELRDVHDNLMSTCPQDMQRAIAAQAEAERERRANVIAPEAKSRPRRNWPTRPT